MPTLIKIVFILSILPIALQANSRPKALEPETDLVLTGGKTLEQFFLERQNDTECRDRLDKIRKDYIEARSKLESLVIDPNATKSEKEKVESLRNSLRRKYLKVVDECGDCEAREWICQIHPKSFSKIRFGRRG